MRTFLALCSLLATGAAATEQGAVNPIRKVVTLLQDMQKEIEHEASKEKELYTKFMCFCKGNTANLSKEGTEAAAKIEEMNAKVKADEAEKAGLSQDLKQHKRDRADAKLDLAGATKLREKEHAAYIEAAGETKTNIDAINSAIPALERGMSSFLQSPAAVHLKRVVATFADSAAPADRDTLLAFLSESENKDYAPQSGQIVGILKNMKDEMDKGLGGIVQEEEAAAKGFEEIKAAKQKEIAAASSAIESKTKRVGELAVQIVESKNAAEDATAELGDSQKFMAELSVSCKTKTHDWEERSKTRTDEIAAISEAITVLNNDDALDLFKAAVKPKVPSTINLGFLQTDNTHKRLAKTTNHVRDLIASAAQMYKNSPALNLLANSLVSKMRLGKVDFSVVIKMIDDMVTLLHKEQKDDASHRDWCNQELDSSDDEEKAASTKINSLDSTIAEVQDGIADLKDQTANTKAKIVELDRSVAEATSQRKAEHREFAETEQLNEAAIQLIFKAKNRLQKFYNPNLYVKAKAKELTREEQIVQGASSFVQIREHEQTDSEVAPPVPPETYGAYTSKNQKGNSVVALMDMLSKELEKDLQEAQHNEKTAQREYAELLLDAQETRQTDAKTVTTCEKSTAELEEHLDESKTGKIIANEELAQVKSYIADLHGSCDFLLANFDLRAQARSNEQDGLTNAKAVLNGASYGL